MSQLALYLFGPPRLELDGDTVHIPRRKATALLAYLAVTGQSHSRDALATLLWPENDQSSARAELRRTLSVLNRILGEGWLVTDRETARLNTDKDLATGYTFWLDVDEYQGKLKIYQSHNHPSMVTCPECLPALEEAVELNSDDFMAGFSLKDCPAYDEWQFFQGEELRTILAKTLVRLSSHHASNLDYETAIAHARRWLALDPLQEAAHRQLMSLFWQSGQRSVAQRQYEQCKQTLADELGVEPSEETKDLYQKIRDNRLAAASRPKSNLPVQTTPFIGRVNELTEIRAKLREADCRLLTLLGPGGSGKTWLAIEAAGGLLDDFRHGVFFVNLAPLEDPTRIPTTIAAALSFSFYEEGTPEEQLLDYLRNKEMLLILDNFEHLLTGVSLINKILNETPRIKILATSRTSMAIQSEYIYPVMGMAYPEISESIVSVGTKYSAVQLFESAAIRRQSAFELTDDNWPDVVRICALVDGMPLGVVLAATWVELLNPSEISKEIDRDLAFLETDMKDLPERQRGMRSVFNHSWRLLSNHERQILKTLSVFRGGFTREAAHKVARASLNDLKRLSHQSMLYRTSDGRFDIHELLRQYAVEKLENNPTVEKTVRDKHSDFYCQALANWESDLEGSRQGVAHAEMTVDNDNIQTAWTWAVEQARLDQLLGAINALCYYYNGHYRRVEAERVCRSLIKRLDALQATTKHEPISQQQGKDFHFDLHQLRIRALACRGYFNWILGNLEIARELSERGLVLLDKEILPSQDLRFEKGINLYILANILKFESMEESTTLAKESVKAFKATKKYGWAGFALLTLGEFTAINHKIKCYEESLALSREHDHPTVIAAALLHLSNIAAYKCEFQKARQMVTEAIEIYREIGLQNGIVDSYRMLGSFLVWEGKFVEARSIVMKMLEIYLDRGRSHTVAFANAIAGYPDLFLGAYEAAYEQAKYGLSLCRNEKHRSAPWGIAYAISILGRVAQVRNNYTEAIEWFHDSISFYQSHESHYNVGQDMASLGQIARERGHISQAQGYLIDSLRIALEEKAFLPLNHALPGIALLFADQGDSERAVELYALASTQGYVANSKWFDDIAGDEIAKAAEELPGEVAEAAKARGRGLDLWETGEGLLVELEELGWENSDK